MLLLKGRTIGRTFGRFTSGTATFCAFLAAILADDERHSWREEDDELMPMPSFNADEESDKEKRWWILLDFDDVHLFRVRLQCLV